MRDYPGYTNYWCKPTEKFIARYLGGPLGGTEQSVAGYLPKIQVPVLRRSNPYISASYSLMHVPVSRYDTEEYVIEGRERRSEADWDEVTYVLTYRWDNPADRLRAENEKLKAEVARSKELVGALDTLKKHLR